MFARELGRQVFFDPRPTPLEMKDAIALSLKAVQRRGRRRNDAHGRPRGPDTGCVPTTGSQGGSIAHFYVHHAVCSERSRVCGCQRVQGAIRRSAFGSQEFQLLNPLLEPPVGRTVRAVLMTLWTEREGLSSNV